MSLSFYMISITQKDLRESCASLHAIAEKTQCAQDLISGNITESIYKNYCYQLWMIADVIEHKINLLDDLQRRHKLIMDIAECSAGPVYSCPSTIAYVRHIAAFHRPDNNGQLKGHIYANYLGWLYGGQMIAKKLNLPQHHLQFNDVRACVDNVRNVHLGMIFDRDADEAKIAFEYIIKIYDELYELH